MKKILYICTNPIENWGILAPLTREDSTQTNFSLLLLHKEQNLENISVSQMWVLNGNVKDMSEGNTLNNISYQDFLEQVFAHDLSMVI